MKMKMLSKCWLAVLLTMSWVASFLLADSQSEGAYLYMEPFYWGAATAAYQSEGAANSDGRGPSIWDTFSAIPGKIHNNDNGNIADDSYNKYMEDIELLKSLGVNSYRFSISWSRILPQGTLQLVNLEGIAHYHKVLDALLAANIEPFVTLYHWDLPQALEDAYGGLLDDRFVTDFVAYADLCFKSFGTKVRHWITINEPWTVSYLAYGEGVFAPGRCSDRRRCHLGDTATESYIAAHNLLKAHAAAADWYKKHYQSTQHGLIGITLNQDWSEPFDVSDYEDVAAAERRREFVFGWFGDPLFFGHYPASMVTLVGDRLPSFTPEESTKLMNSVDFLGINHYTTKYILHRHPGGLDANPQLQRLQRQNPQYFNDSILPFLTDLLRRNGHEQGWAADQLTIESYYGYDGQVIGPQGGSPWLHSVPEGFYNMLMWVHRRYALFFKAEEVNTWPVGKRRPPFVYITENGCDVLQESQLSFPQVLQDDFRIEYFTQYLHQLDRAIQDGAQIKGYFAWSLMDNFEWADGYDMRFGLHYVNFSDPNRTRYPKQSAHWYRQYIERMRMNYTGTTRVIVPSHRPVYPPILGTEPPRSPSSIASGAMNRFTWRRSLQTFWQRLSRCTRDTRRRPRPSSTTTATTTTSDTDSSACAWWESLLSSYVAQSMLQANWPHGDFL